MAKNLDYAVLLELYGSVLTEKQRELMELYYWEDMSLGEISETCGITRQGVRDGVKRGEHTLSDMEKKLRFAEKTEKIKYILSDISALAADLNGDRAERISRLAADGRELF